MTDLESLEHTHGTALTYLESKRECDRYAHPSHSDPDGSSTWICQHCDSTVEDPDEGCLDCTSTGLETDGDFD